jgi:hypothetical protein
MHRPNSSHSAQVDGADLFVMDCLTPPLARLCLTQLTHSWNDTLSTQGAFRFPRLGRASPQASMNVRNVESARVPQPFLAKTEWIRRLAKYLRRSPRLVRKNPAWLRPGRRGRSRKSPWRAGFVTDRAGSSRPCSTRRLRRGVTRSHNPGRASCETVGHRCVHGAQNRSGSPRRWFGKPTPVRVFPNPNSFPSENSKSPLFRPQCLHRGNRGRPIRRNHRGNEGAGHQSSSRCGQCDGIPRRHAVELRRNQMPRHDRKRYAKH